MTSCEFSYPSVEVQTRPERRSEESLIRKEERKSEVKKYKEAAE